MKNITTKINQSQFNLDILCGRHELHETVTKINNVQLPFEYFDLNAQFLLVSIKRLISWEFNAEPSCFDFRSGWISKGFSDKLNKRSK